MQEFRYSGEELDTFALATNWKAYWSSLVRPYLGGAVLEVGAGIGANTQILKDSGFERWVCVEPDADLCGVIQGKIRTNILPAKIEVISCVTADLSEQNVFDCILYIDVLEHIQNDKDEIKTAMSLLKEQGRIVVLSPAHNYLFSPFDKKIGHFRRYDKKSLGGIIPAGARVIDMRYLDCIGYFASLANRVILKASDPKAAQIMFWDSYLVALSKIIDPLIAFRAGKSIFAVIEKSDFG